ncbi:hypothetical protein [Cytobacillus horneckiae]|uniref:hypothetical protein n=1 Tax=Cytobacillus horneckiae TaxID=549687 RepID=UPI003D258843
MLTLEEYIAKRKREDKVNEFDINSKMDNMRICVNYVFGKESWQPYLYDYKQKTNLFNLNTLYTRISKNPFIKGKKQFFEIIMMYIWLHSIWGDEDNYWAEYMDKSIK